MEIIPVPGNVEQAHAPHFDVWLSWYVVFAKLCVKLLKFYLCENYDCQLHTLEEVIRLLSSN